MYPELHISVCLFPVVTSNSQQLLENPSKIKEFHVSPECIYICLSLTACVWLFSETRSQSSSFSSFHDSQPFAGRHKHTASNNKKSHELRIFKISNAKGN